MSRFLGVMGWLTASSYVTACATMEPNAWQTQRELLAEKSQRIEAIETDSAIVEVALNGFELSVKAQRSCKLTTIETFKEVSTRDYSNKHQSSTVLAAVTGALFTLSGVLLVSGALDEVSDPEMRDPIGAGALLSGSSLLMMAGIDGLRATKTDKKTTTPVETKELHYQFCTEQPPFPGLAVTLLSEIVSEDGVESYQLPLGHTDEKGSFYAELSNVSWTDLGFPSDIQLSVRLYNEATQVLVKQSALESQPLKRALVNRLFDFLLARCESLESLYACDSLGGFLGLNVMFKRFQEAFKRDEPERFAKGMAVYREQAAYATFLAEQERHQKAWDALDLNLCTQKKVTDFDAQFAACEAVFEYTQAFPEAPQRAELLIVLSKAYNNLQVQGEKERKRLTLQIAQKERALKQAEQQQERELRQRAKAYEDTHEKRSKPVCVTEGAQRLCCSTSYQQACYQRSKQTREGAKYLEQAAKACGCTLN